MFDSWRRLRHRPALHTSSTLGHRAPRLREEQTTNSVSAIGAAAGVLYAQYLAYSAYLPYCSRRFCVCTSRHSLGFRKPRSRLMTLTSRLT